MGDAAPALDNLRTGLSISMIAFPRDHGHEAHATSVLPIGATVYATRRTQIAIEIIFGGESRRSTPYSGRTRLKMEVEGGRRDKEGIKGQVMSPPGCCGNAIEKDVVVPDQAGDRSEARVDHWDRGVPIVDVVEHPDIVGLSCGDFTARSMRCIRSRLCRGHIIFVCSIIEDIHVLASIDCDAWTAIIVSNVIINLDSSTIASQTYCYRQ